MFVEGCITQGYLQALRVAGYNIQLAIESGEEASRLIQNNCDLPDPADHDYGQEPWVRIYFDSDIEDVIGAEEVVNECKEEGKLPLLVGNPDSRIAREVEKALSSL